MTLHRVAAVPETVRIGIFDAGIPPVLTVRSGDTVVLECMTGDETRYPPPELGFTVPAALRTINDAAIHRRPGHIITGPVAIEGAEPGDMLEVRIDAIALGADYGFCGFRPLAGTLPEDFPRQARTGNPRMISVDKNPATPVPRRR